MVFQITSKGVSRVAESSNIIQREQLASHLVTWQLPRMPKSEDQKPSVEFDQPELLTSKISVRFQDVKQSRSLIKLVILILK